MRKFYVFILMIASVWPAAAWAFTDVSVESPYFTAIEDVRTRGLVTGYDDGSFGIEREINRAESLKLALSTFQAGALAAEKDQDWAVPFEDVEGDTWYFMPISLAVEKKIVSGYADGTFKPGQTVNLAEAVKILLQSAEVVIDADATVPYRDVAADAWYRPYVGTAYNLHLINSQSDGFLHPEQALTRGQFTEIVSRLLWVKEHQNKPFPHYEHWQGFQREEHFYRVRAPYDWEIIEDTNGTVFWKRDVISGQESFLRVTPYTAVAHVVFDVNSQKLAANDYFSKVEEHLGKDFGTFKRFSLNGAYSALRVDADQGASSISDLYIELPNRTFVIFYSSFGNSELAPELREFLLSLQHSFQYVSGGGFDIDSVLEQTRQAIGVDGKGSTTLSLYSDKELFETDDIGVGTGAVDYYYSALANVTLKYERSFDVILAMRDGKTSAF